MTIKKQFVFMAAALVDNGGIGNDNGLPWSIPGDWQFFENVTTKSYGDQRQTFEDTTEWTNVIITGRQSFESRPMLSKPLFNRFNIVVSRNPNYKM
jgi:dihydrofolate reductase